MNKNIRQSFFPPGQIRGDREIVRQVELGEGYLKIQVNHVWIRFRTAPVNPSPNIRFLKTRRIVSLSQKKTALPFS